MRNPIKKSAYKWIILVACILVYAASQIVRWNYSSITKYLVDDFHIGKSELGVLGAAFFYSYAAAQVPWGLAVDKFGARRVVPLATCILGCFLACFAFSGSYGYALMWRILMGVAAAAGYVSINSVISKWFAIRERGWAMSLFSGVGGAFGEVLSFLLIPVLAVVMSTGLFGITGWNASTIVMGVIVSLIGVIAAVALRSDPTVIGLPSVQKAEDATPDVDYGNAAKQVTKDPALWLLSGVLSCYVVGTRLIPAWLPLYATELYIYKMGMSKEMAIVAGGAMATVYVAGRCLGVPVVGLISDILLKKFGVPRFALITGAMIASTLIFAAFAMPMASSYEIGALSFIAGVVFNSFSLLNAATAEILSVKTAGYCTAIINTSAQIVGAMVLTVSGYMAVYFSVAGGAFYTEFQGIWYLGSVFGIVGALLAAAVIRREITAIKARQIVTM